MGRMFASFFFGLLLVVLSSFPTSAEKLKFSFGSLAGSNSPVWVAKERGFFKKYGIDAELLYIVGGRVSTQALVAGEVQMGTMGPSAIIRAALAGADLVYVMGMSDPPNFQLVAQKEITDIKQLRGKRVGIGQFGGGPDYSVRVVLERSGLIPDKDVLVIQMGVGVPGRLAAVRARSIESVVISPPITLLARKEGFNVLVDFLDVIPDFISSAVATSRSYLKQNPKAVESGLRALIEACKYIRSNEEGTKKIIAQYMKLEDTAILDQYYREVILKEITNKYFLNVKGIQFVIEQEGKRDPKIAQAKPEDFIDHRFLDKLKREGYF